MVPTLLKFMIWGYHYFWKKKQHIRKPPSCSSFILVHCRRSGLGGHHPDTCLSDWKFGHGSHGGLSYQRWFGKSSGRLWGAVRETGKNTFLPSSSRKTIHGTWIRHGGGLVGWLCGMFCLFVLAKREPGDGTKQLEEISTWSRNGLCLLVCNWAVSVDGYFSKQYNYNVYPVPVFTKNIKNTPLVLSNSLHVSLFITSFAESKSCLVGLCMVCKGTLPSEMVMEKIPLIWTVQYHGMSQGFFPLAVYLAFHCFLQPYQNRFQNQFGYFFPSFVGQVNLSINYV